MPNSIISEGDVILSFDSDEDTNKEIKTIKKRCSIYRCVQLCMSMAIPITIIVYTIIQDKRELNIAKEHREQDADLADRTRLNDLQIADNQLKDAVLNGYLDFLSNLLEKNGIYLDKDPSARLVARLKTLAILKLLDGKRKIQLFQSLVDAKLIDYIYVNYTGPIIDLSGADLIGLKTNIFNKHSLYQGEFRNKYLCNTDLTNSSFRDLSISGGKFNGAIMNGADFSESKSWFLEDTCVDNTIFHSASLIDARFTDAFYQKVNFDFADMVQSQLQHFTCDGCDFRESDFSRADLSYSSYDRYFCTDSSGENYDPPSFDRSLFIDTNLYKSVFHYAEFYRNSMLHINATEINCENCYFADVRCFNCSFYSSIIVNSTFFLGDFTGSKMVSASMEGTAFENITMRKMDFSHGNFHDCVFLDVDLTDSIFINTSFVGTHFKGTHFTDKQVQQMRINHNFTYS